MHLATFTCYTATQCNLLGFPPKSLSFLALELTESLDIQNSLCYNVSTFRSCTIRLAVRIPACHAGDQGFESPMVRCHSQMADTLMEIGISPMCGQRNWASLQSTFDQTICNPKRLARG